MARFLCILFLRCMSIFYTTYNLLIFNILRRIYFSESPYIVIFIRPNFSGCFHLSSDIFPPGSVFQRFHTVVFLIPLFFVVILNFIITISFFTKKSYQGMVILGRRLLFKTNPIRKFCNIKNRVYCSWYTF